MSRFLVLRWIGTDHPWRNAALLVIVTAMVPFFTCWIDGTLIIAGPMRGLLEDPVFPFDLLSRFLFLSLAVSVLARFNRAFAFQASDAETTCPGHLDPHVNQGSIAEQLRLREEGTEGLTRSGFRNAVTRCRDLIVLRTRWSIVMYAGVVTLGLLSHASFLLEQFLRPPEHGTWALQTDHLLTFTAAEFHNILLYGFLLPDVIYLLLSISYGTHRIMSELARHSALHLRPMAPDNCGGLSCLGKLAVGNSMPILAALPHLVAWLIVVPNRVMGSVALIATIGLSTGFAVGPLRAIHRYMKQYRLTELHVIGVAFHVIYDRFVHAVRNQKMGEAQELTGALGALTDVSRTVRQMQVWPVDVRTSRRFLATIFLPALFLVVNVAKGWGDHTEILGQVKDFLSRALSGAG